MSEYAVLSCDVDTVDRHLAGYGFAEMPPCDRVYRTAVPRLLELLDELHLKAVFFLIARDAEQEEPLLRRLVAAGHEVASHSLTHPLPFRALDDGALAHELGESRTRLTAAAGAEVLGFRAPGWDTDARVMRMVRKAGYRYDASIFPTPILVAGRIVAYRRSATKARLLAADLMNHALSPPVPHRLNDGARGLMEFPLPVTPWLRLPIYHTFSYFVPARLFARGLKAVLGSGRPLCYEFHAADLLDLERDGVDPRMGRHPGMRLGAEEKRRGLREVLARIAGARRVVTYQQALEEGLAA